MAAALLIGTNAWAAELTLGTAESGATYQTLQAAFDAAASGDVINLTSNLTTAQTAWLGTKLATDPAKNIILDLKGYTYDYTGSKNVAIALTHGKLTIQSSGSEGLIQTATAKDELVRVYGTYQEIDPVKGTPFSYLIISEGVELKSTKKNVLSVDVLRPGQATLFGKTNADFGYTCDLLDSKNSKGNWQGYGVANGVRVDVSGTLTSEVKYALKVNGCVRYIKDYVEDGTTTFKTNYPSYKDDVTNYKGALEPRANGGTKDGVYTITSTAGEFAPYIYVAPSGRLKTNDTAKEAVAAYSSGYGRWLIKGYCGGSTGLYIKSGVIVAEDATIESTNTNHTKVEDGQSSGVTAGGSAIVIESNASYSGSTSVTIAGNTTVEGKSGYAIEETITTATGSEVNAVDIQGGTIIGGDAGAIIVEDETQNQVTVVGGNFEGTIEVENGSGTATSKDVEDFIPTTEDVHTTEITVDGKTIIVISDGSNPNDYATVAGHANGRVNWTGNSEEITGNYQLAQLTINQNVAQELTIKAGAKFTVGSVVLGEKAKIIVEPGAQFIVTDKDGVANANVNNIILQTSEAAQAIFLFNPAVTQNAHPKATVQFSSKSYMKSGVNVFQRFGIPTNTALESMTSNDPSVRTRVWKYSAAADAWQELGDLGSFDVAQLNVPFAGYNSIAYTETANMVYTMTGSLVGNQDGELNAPLNWNVFANSYSGNIDITKFLNALTGNMDATVYAYKVTNATTQEYTWDPVNEISLLFDPAVKIAPMQAFILHKIGKTNGQSVIDYNNVVYKPAVAGGAGAPRRSALANLDITKIGMTIANENGAYDKLYLVESDEFTADYERGRDAEKYMNDDINVYAHAAEKQATLATNNLENTYVGFSTVKGGKFTMSFVNVEGRELALIDHETGAQVAIVEGATYEFTANGNNDYRFEIVGAAKLPTAIENTEAVKSAKGIYTITGQYVGEMNVWSTLPAGIYVVNGEKLVK